MGYSHGTRWSDGMIADGIMEVVAGMELDRMPSYTECEQYFGNSGLVSAVSKHGGWDFWAQKLNLDAKRSETYFGKSQEALVAGVLTEQGFSVQRTPQNYAYDLLVDNAVKIDVKASRLYQSKDGQYFSFRVAKPYATCDVYVLCAMADASSVRTFYVIPSTFVMTHRQISIGVLHSKYDRFIDAWHYIRSCSDYWARIQ